MPDVAKWASIAISILGAGAAIWARFIAVEQRQTSFTEDVVEIRHEVQDLRTRVEHLEQDRDLFGRVVKLEERLNAIQDRIDDRRRR